MAKQSASMQMLFLVMAGALAMAGITASLVFRFGRRARKRRLERRRERRAMWDRSIRNVRCTPDVRRPRCCPMKLLRRGAVTRFRIRARLTIRSAG